MTNLVAELAKFARHSDLCAVDQWLPTDVEDWAVPPCNCGLAQLLEQVMQVEPPHEHPLRQFCTCPAPGTSNSKIDPMCPIAFPHPWERNAPNRGAE